VPCSLQNFQPKFHPQQTCPIADDPIKYWGKIGKELYGNLAAVAKQYLAGTAPSVPLERLFSKAGIVLTKRRNRLSSERLSRLIFVSSVGEE
jgi:hypothetical protein